MTNGNNNSTFTSIYSHTKSGETVPLHTFFMLSLALSSHCHLVNLPYYRSISPNVGEGVSYGIHV